jgi:predicted ATPase/DNA-binding CsgD family transcriptional regulator
VANNYGRTSGFPGEYSSFVGRRKDLSSARSVLGATRLLTIVGPGGVGKTRFAVRLVDSVRRHWRDGSWFVGLSDARDTDSIVDEVNRGLELPDVMGEGFEVFRRAFADKKALIVIDNCEHVLAASADFVTEVLRHCPEITVVTTSREALRLTSEVEFRLPPLGTEATTTGGISNAATLFIDRCSPMLPDLSREDLSAIDEICRVLQGIPLAIELAAARTRILAPQQILAQLSTPLSLLVGGARDAPGRQQTLRATIDWSYQLCSEDEKVLWRRMSVFMGGWELEAAAWMVRDTSDPDGAWQLVESLLEKSVLTRRVSEGVVIFDMLTTIRHYGLDATSGSELEDARQSHRDFMMERLAALEADWYGPNQARWLDFAHWNLTNIRAALDYTIACGDAARAATLLITGWRIVWQMPGRVDEFMHRVHRILDIDADPTADLCQLMGCVGSWEGLFDPESSRRHLDRAGEIAEELDDDFLRAFTLTSTGDASIDRHTAIAAYTKALALQGGTDQIIARDATAERLAGMHAGVGNVEVAERMRSELIDRATQLGDSLETAEMLLQSSFYAVRSQHWDDATRMLHQALSLNSRIHHFAGINKVLELLAIAAVGAREHTRAATLLGISQPNGDPRGAIASSYPGNATLRAEAEDAARKTLGAAAFEKAFTRGTALSPDEGVAFALGTQPAPRATRRPIGPGLDELTPREREVASLIGQGLTDREVAARLVISKRTAEGHVNRILVKLGLTSRTQLATWFHHQDG